MTVLTLPPLGAVARRAGRAAGDAELSAGRLIALARLTASRPHPSLEDPPERWLGSGPVVLVGGFCATDLVLGPMRRWLERLGYSVSTHTLGAGMGCAGRSIEAVADTVRRAADTHGAPVRVVAHSRGGQFARAATRTLARTGEAPESLVTLGTPLRLYGASRVLLAQAAAVAALGSLLAQAAAVAALGSLGAPGLATLACLYGPCCAEFRDELRAPVPVPCTAVFSREDRAVKWQAAVDPAARNIEVPGSHLGLLVDPPALRVVAEALATRDRGRPGEVRTVPRRHVCAA